MENEALIKQTVEKFIDIIGYAVEYTVTPDDENSTMHVEITGENLGGLIGFHGKNIPSIEHILNLMAARENGSMMRFLTLDINAYRKDRLNTIKRYVINAINKVQKTHRPYDLYPMSSYERLFVHKLVTEYPGLITESNGVEPNRTVTIKPKTEE